MEFEQSQPMLFTIGLHILVRAPLRPHSPKLLTPPCLLEGIVLIQDNCASVFSAVKWRTVVPILVKVLHSGNHATAWRKRLINVHLQVPQRGSFLRPWAMMCSSFCRNPGEQLGGFAQGLAREWMYIYPRKTPVLKSWPTPNVMVLGGGDFGG